MGDISAEPSMEDILSSIKRIIAEEGDQPATPVRQRRQPRAAATPPPVHDDEADLRRMDEVLELNDPMPQPIAAAPLADPAPAAPISPPVAARSEAPVEAPMISPVPAAASPEPAEPIVSRQAAAATRGSLDQLSRMMVKPEPPSDGTLEGLVRDMLRPMLREWLDTNLPPMVEAMVAREIAKITGQ